MDTREIRQVLGDEIPFSDPDVLGFLRQTLEEGEQQLEQGPATGTEFIESM